MTMRGKGRRRCLWSEERKTEFTLKGRRKKVKKDNAWPGSLRNEIRTKKKGLSTKEKIKR